MKRAAAGAVVFTLLLAACTPTMDDPPTTTTRAPAPTTSTTLAEAPLDPDGFYVMLMWHQHQPLYPTDADGVVTRPWVRVHAAKDYYDMAALVGDYPDLHVTFNLTPVLMLQLQDIMNGARDSYWVHTEVPADELSEAEKAFLEARFFDTNPLIIERFPRYQQLSDKRSRGDTFTAADYRDLQVLFNLAWTDPDFLAAEPLASLVAKGRDYAEADKQVVLDTHLDIVGQVFDIHRELWNSGQIEITTTPLAHPILPLIGDTNLALVGDPTATLPQNRFREVPDAREHVRQGLDVAEELLGTRPSGMWPGEGAVAQLVTSVWAGEGVEWIATGEDVLGMTLDMGSFTRTSGGTVEEAEVLYRPYAAQHQRNPRLPIFFRDVELSDQIAFEYSQTPGEEAAEDFMNRLRQIERQLEGVSGPKVVTVIVDGENAWEHYENDGKDFLNALYRKLTEAEFVDTIYPSELLAAFPESPEPLPEVFPASWFQPNFATWIGEQEEADAWDYLATARSDYADAETSGTTEPAALDAAFSTLLFAQGSDWFWWYGQDQDSGDDQYFDRAFRELIGQMYDALAIDRPAYVRVPIVPDPEVAPDRTPEGLATIDIDDDISELEWEAAGRYALAATDWIDGFSWIFDTDTLFLRVDFADGALEDEAAQLDLYVSVPSAEPKRGATVDGTVLGFNASHLLRWTAEAPRTTAGPIPLPPLGSGDGTVGSLPDGSSLPTGFDGSGIELAVPLESLGAVGVGDPLRFSIVDRRGDVDGPTAPAGGPGVMLVPDISDVAVALEVVDPTGDDHGPGTYTYPTDPVFGAGSYDLTAFSVGESGDELVFSFEIAGAIQNSWDSPNGLSVQTFDVYVDTDPGAPTGARLFLPGRNASWVEGSGWERALTIEGWQSALYEAAADGTSEETQPTFKVLVFPDKGRVVARLPRSLFPDGDPQSWQFAVALLSQEGFPSSGVRRVRDVEPTASQYRIGGGTAAINETRIIDLAWPEPGVQETLLGGFTPIDTGSSDDLGADDFAQVPPLP